MNSDFIKKINRIRELIKKLAHTAEFDKLSDREKIKILDANIKLTEVFKELTT